MSCPGGCVHTLTGHQSLTSGMELRDHTLVSGNADSTVRVWDIRTGQCLHTLQGEGRGRGGGPPRHLTCLCVPGPHRHQSAVTCLQFCRGLVLSSSDDGTVKLWDLKTGAWLRDVVALQSRGSGQRRPPAVPRPSPGRSPACRSTGGVVWRIRASDTQLVCAAGSRNGTEETKLLVLDFDLEDGTAGTDGTDGTEGCGPEPLPGPEETRCCGTDQDVPTKSPHLKSA